MNSYIQITTTRIKIPRVVEFARYNVKRYDNRRVDVISVEIELYKKKNKEKSLSVRSQRRLGNHGVGIGSSAKKKNRSDLRSVFIINFLILNYDGRTRATDETKNIACPRTLIFTFQEK